MIDLLIALAIGLLIGLERGWYQRDEPDGQRLAGIRTFTLIGLLGGVFGRLALAQEPWLFGAGFGGLALVLAVGHYRESQRDGENGITTVVAALLTFALAGLVPYGWRLEAIGGAAVMAALLSSKAELHGWLRRVQRLELHAALQLLVVAAVVLPLLPDHAMGPWGVLVPRKIGWLVLLIAGLSFAGYLAVKLVGARYGLLAMGALGGLVSSTAVVLHLSSRLRQPDVAPQLPAAAMLAACAMMAPRVLVLASAVAPSLLPALLVPAVALTLPLLAAIAVQLRHAGPETPSAEMALSNPMSVVTAIEFALMIAGIMLGVEAARQWMGAGGVLMAAALSGIVDVDALTLSLAQSAHAGGEVPLAARGIVVALIVNSLAKAVMSLSVGGRAAWRRTVLPLLVSALAGGAGALWIG